MIKKILYFLPLLLFNTTELKAQFNLGGILNEVTRNLPNDNSTDGLIKGLTSVFNPHKVASKSQLVGTWIYEEPALLFDSDNALKKFGGRYASNILEKKLQKSLNKVGVKQGIVKMTFTDDNRFTQTAIGRTLSGTYKINGKTIELYYGGTIKQMIGTTQLDMNSLMIVVNTGKFIPYIRQITELSQNNTLRTVSMLLKDVKGMQCGLALRREKP